MDGSSAMQCIRLPRVVRQSEEAEETPQYCPRHKEPQADHRMNVTMYGSIASISEVARSTYPPQSSPGMTQLWTLWTPEATHFLRFMVNKRERVTSSHGLTLGELCYASLYRKLLVKWGMSVPGLPVTSIVDVFV